MRLTVGLARALGELAEDHEPLMARALMAIAQQKALVTLAEKEEVTPGDLNAIANLTRAAIAQQRWAAQLKAQAEPQHQTAADRKCGPPDMDLSRNALQAIARLEPGHAAALAASEEPVGHSDPPGETGHGDEGRLPVDQCASETGIAVDGSSIAGRDGAFAASPQPALLRASPRIAADLCAKEGAMPVVNSGLRRAPSPCVERTSTQGDAELRT